MDNVIVVASGKGGTGKSTVCICLSVALIKQGKKVLLIDCDCGMRGLDIMLDMENDIVFDAADAVSGNCSFTDAVYKSKNNENLYLMAAPFDTDNELSPGVFRQLVDTLKADYDFVIIDCPPSLSMLTINAMTTADSVLVPIQCEYYALEGLSQLIHTVELVKDRLNPDLEIEGVVFTMYDARTNLS